MLRFCVGRMRAGAIYHQPLDGDVTSLVLSEFPHPAIFILHQDEEIIPSILIFFPHLWSFEKGYCTCMSFTLTQVKVSLIYLREFAVESYPGGVGYNDVKSSAQV